MALFAVLGASAQMFSWEVKTTTSAYEEITNGIVADHGDYTGTDFKKLLLDADGNQNFIAAEDVNAFPIGFDLSYNGKTMKYFLIGTDGEILLSDVKTIELVEEDAEAFYPLSKAYGIPRDDPRRAEVLEKAAKNACGAPLEMMRQICHAIELLEEMGAKGSRMLYSDIGCGALMCRAALEAASLNVFVNTKTLADRDFAKKAEEECDEMLVAYIPRAEACAVAVMAHIRA